MTASTQGTLAPYRSEMPPTKAGFAQLVRSEWTKFCTVTGWPIGLLTAIVVTIGVGLLSALGSNVSCATSPAPGADGETGGGCQHTVPPLGPDGTAVSDNFNFVHQSLTGDGSITVAVTSFTGQIPAGFEAPEAPGEAAPHNDVGGMQPGLVPWAKAGLIIKDGLTPGSAYAAIMTTADHGVRLQSDYTQDIAGTVGPVGAVTEGNPQWLRLSRSGDVVTGEQSTDGTTWTTVGSVTLAGFPRTVQLGMFVTSPEYEVTSQGFGSSSTIGGPSVATATFDEVSVQGGSPGDEWSGDTVGGDGGTGIGGFTEDAGIFTVSGSGDIAPRVGGPGPNTVERNGIGTFAGLIVMIVIGTMFVTAEYRRGLIRTTFAAHQGRGQVLTAKAVVLGAVSFVTGLVAAATCMWVIGWIQARNGISVIPVPWFTQLRIVVGTAAVFTAVAVLALAVGAILRRSAGAVAIAIVLVVLPYILAVASVLPVGPAQWLLRLTPAAGFAVQQSIPEYPQVEAFYSPSTGYFPLSPPAGFGVLCLWAAAALVLAVVHIRRRDA
jgi:ABC-type transport system involved in multi-copper enzyme maturation permease subunit